MRNNRSEKNLELAREFERTSRWSSFLSLTAPKQRRRLFSGLRRRLVVALVASRDGTRFATSVRGPASS
jgi:hypothetical protein